jgi:Arc/MetJ family transcription regulator
MEIWLVIAVIVGIAIIFSVIRAQQLKEAKTAYQAALTELTSSPADNNLRVAALEAGRRYADLARKAAGSKGRAIFDEVALSNDLNARSGAPPSTSAHAKKCPQCAELVKPDARICRFCQHKFETAA